MVVGNITLSDIIMIIQSTIFFLTLLVMYSQLRNIKKQTDQLSKNVEFNNISSLLSRHIDLHKFLIENPKLSKFFAYHKEIDTEEKIFDDHYVMYMTDTFELFFILYQRGLIPEDIWEISFDNMKRVVETDQRFELFWKMKYKTLRGRFDKKFMQFMQENIMGKVLKETIRKND